MLVLLSPSYLYRIHICYVLSILSFVCLQFLTLYATSCTLLVFLINIILFITPGVAYGIMTKVVGLTDELAQLSLMPLKISMGISLLSE